MDDGSQLDRRGRRRSIAHSPEKDVAAEEFKRMEAEAAQLLPVSRNDSEKGLLLCEIADDLKNKNRLLSESSETDSVNSIGQYRKKSRGRTSNHKRRSSDATSDTSSEKRRSFPNRQGLSFEIGSYVKVRDTGTQWYDSKIVEMDDDKMEIKIHFNGWNNRYDKWVPMSSKDVRPVSPDRLQKLAPQQLVSRFKVDDEVLAKWNKDDIMYPAKIIRSLGNGQFEVLFYDEVIAKVHSAKMEPMPEKCIGRLVFPSVEEARKKMKRGSLPSTSGEIIIPVKEDAGLIQAGNAETSKKKSNKEPSPDIWEILKIAPPKVIKEAPIEQQKKVATKEFVIEEDHNHFKCTVADCGKSFRKENLLESHMKHYHKMIYVSSRRRHESSSTSRSGERTSLGKSRTKSESENVPKSTKKVSKHTQESATRTQNEGKKKTQSDTLQAHSSASSAKPAQKSGLPPSIFFANATSNHPKAAFSCGSAVGSMQDNSQKAVKKKTIQNVLEKLSAVAAQKISTEESNENDQTLKDSALSPESILSELKEKDQLESIEADEGPHAAGTEEIAKSEILIDPTRSASDSAAEESVELSNHASTSEPLSTKSSPKSLSPEIAIIDRTEVKKPRKQTTPPVTPVVPQRTSSRKVSLPAKFASDEICLMQRVNIERTISSSSDKSVGKEIDHKLTPAKRPRLSSRESGSSPQGSKTIGENSAFDLAKVKEEPEDVHHQRHKESTRRSRPVKRIILSGNVDPENIDRMVTIASSSSRRRDRQKKGSVSLINSILEPAKEKAKEVLPNQAEISSSTVLVNEERKENSLCEPMPEAVQPQISELQAPNGDSLEKSAISFIDTSFIKEEDRASPTPDSSTNGQKEMSKLEMALTSNSSLTSASNLEPKIDPQDASAELNFSLDPKQVVDYKKRPELVGSSFTPTHVMCTRRKEAILEKEKAAQSIGGHVMCTRKKSVKLAAVEEKFKRKASTPAKGDPVSPAVPSPKRRRLSSPTRFSDGSRRHSSSRSESSAYSGKHPLITKPLELPIKQEFPLPSDELKTDNDEVVHCICDSTEEEGLMMQCEICLTWQHGLCFNIDAVEDVPEKYMCYACQNPKGSGARCFVQRRRKRRCSV